MAILDTATETRSILSGLHQKDFQALSSPWIVSSLVLYGLVGACWLPVVWVQVKLRDLASAARDADKPLPARYHRLFRVWFILGWPAFAGVVAILALMIAKPRF